MGGTVRPLDYRFEAPGRADLPMLRRWRDEPHVRRRWPDFEEEIAAVEAGTAAEGFVPRIVRTADGVPFGWVQDYALDVWPMRHHGPAPAGARGMDTMIGDPAFLGHGHAPRYLRQRAEQLVAAGASLVVADPEVGNPRAVRAWRAAGFEGDRVVRGEGGRAVAILTFAARSRARPSETL